LKTKVQDQVEPNASIEIFQTATQLQNETKNNKTFKTAYDNTEMKKTKKLNEEKNTYLLKNQNSLYQMMSLHFMTDCSSWRFEKGGRSNGCDGSRRAYIELWIS